MLTCPYLFELETIAYFALLRRRHSFHAVASIRETTQLLLDVHRHGDKLYVQPLKVWERYTPTMYLPHAWEGAEFRPVTESAAISGIYATLAATGMSTPTGALDLWDRTFHEAQQVLDDVARGVRQPAETEELFWRVARMVASRDERMLALVAKYMTLEDLLDIRRRMIGTGLIGGKSVGMLLARAILKKSDPHWQRVLEAHDSFYVGSDVFYLYLVKNGCWRLRQRQRDPEAFLSDVDDVQTKMLTGTFPEFVRQQFADMLDYFGQSPIVVRSSSLLEDNFGNAFSGKYESVFCITQGTPQERLDAFIAAVRQVYTAAMGREALLYRAERGLLESDEQMALLVQRVSGGLYGRFFLPQVAGVGLSFNPFVWSEQIEPEAGVLRDVELQRRAREQGKAEVFPWVLTFDRLLTATPFVQEMRNMLRQLQQAYDYPVDIEFTANFLEDKSYRINLVQCRPFQVMGGGPSVQLPDAVPAGDLVLEARGAIIGPSLSTKIGRLVFVVPQVYGQLSQSDRYSIARLIGRITRLGAPRDGSLMLLGPGRWGTTTPSLGVPVSFAEINRVSVLGEIVEMREGLVPDVSLGTHFFNDLVEMQILYLAVFPGHAGHVINRSLLEGSPNRLADLLPDEARWVEVVRVIDAADLPEGRSLLLEADVLRQRAVCYVR
jgi:hypothetical protein